MKINKFSEIGKHHIETGKENQDALCFDENEKVCVISLADGVSTCSESKKGAEIACATITDFFMKMGEELLGFNEKNIANFIVSRIMYELKKYADENSKNVEDYSSTIASIMIDKRSNKMLCFSLGDSLVGTVKEGNYSVVIPPSDSTDGCYVTTTRGAADEAKIKVTNVGVTESLFICSDGAWKKMYERNKINEDICRIIENKDYYSLEKYLKKEDNFDDLSFISVDI
ncbi:MAG: protein phosphatase 2C domain-containing protein [Lachnospiraceae bacterium]|nr:protein phosphatase 2C domain-containing protein [Lachnospiraceae bacterium]